jgi:hypothetical protein
LSSSFIVDICGVRVRVVSPDIDFEQFLASCGHWIPSLRRGAEGAVDLELAISYGPDRLRFGPTGVELRERESPFHLSLSGAVLISRYVERLLNARGRYSVHASCIARGSDALVLIGPAFAGKTTIAALCSVLDRDVRVLSGDRTVVERSHVIGGTTRLAFRNGTLLHDLPELAVDVDANGDIWQLQTFVDFPDAVFPGHYRIRGFCVLGRAPGPARVHEVTGPDRFLRVYENVVYFADEFPSVALSQRQPMPRFTTMAAQRRRIRYVEGLIDTVPVKTVSGGLRQVAGALLTQLDSLRD